MALRNVGVLGLGLFGTAVGDNSAFESTRNYHFLLVNNI